MFVFLVTFRLKALVFSVVGSNFVKILYSVVTGTLASLVLIAIQENRLVDSFYQTIIQRFITLRVRNESLTRL